MDEERENTENPAPEGNEPVWCVAANVRDEIPFGEGALETRRGTKQFRAGAKVYLAGSYKGTGSIKVIVIGHYRGRKYITASLYVRYLTSWRAELVYSPTVIARLKEIPIWDTFGWDSSDESKDHALEEAQSFSKFSDLLHNERLAKRQTAQNTDNLEENDNE